MTSSLVAWTLRGRWSANGASDLLLRGFQASRRNLGAGDPPSFPPSVVVQVKALACELPHRLQLPLSRLSLSEIRREVIAQGLVAEISRATLWRWLSADALRPWRYRSWIFPRDPDFFHSLNELEQRWLAFQRRYEGTASPFQWTFTRKDLATLLAKIENKRFAPAA